MQHLISEKQARQITGGHTPLVPVEYEEAIRALTACTHLDEAKYWSNKADALAAWAKIYHSHDAERKAKQLKLHAFRRMGELAEELRPTMRGSRVGHWGSPPGARSLLVESGLNKQDASNAVAVAKLPAEKFFKYVHAPRIPTPDTVRKVESSKSSAAWFAFLRGPDSVGSFLSFTRRYPAAKLAQEMTPDERAKARVICTELVEWLDEFDRHVGEPAK